MTALKEFERLESGGLWRETAEAQRRDVVVSFGKATLVISDSAGRALTHWSLAAVARLNGAEVPALYAPDADVDSETLEIDDTLMIEAIEKVRRTVARNRPRPGILRHAITGSLVLGTLALGVFWLPGALERQALAVVPPVKRSEIGATVLGFMQAEAGRMCRSAAALDVLGRLHDRLFGRDAVGQIVAMPLAGASAVVLPGQIKVIDTGLLGEVDDPAIVAGALLNATAAGPDPLEPILQEGQFATVIRLLTTSEVPPDVLEDHAMSRIDAPPLDPGGPGVADAFAAAAVPIGPWASHRGASLPEVTDAPRPVLSDTDWVRLQTLCGV